MQPFDSGTRFSSFFIDNAALLNQRFVNIDLTDVVDNNGHLQPLSLANTLVEHWELAAAR